MRRLRNGPLISDILETFENVSRNSSWERKMNMYSAHDTTLSSFLNGLGIYNGISPPYASCVMVELLRTKTGNGDHFVRFYYRNETRDGAEPRLLQLPGCDSGTCPLDKVLEVTKSLRPAHWHRECRSKHSYEDTVIDVVTVLSAFIGITLLCAILGAVFYKLCCRRKPLGGGSGGYEEVGQGYT
jgi:hypothetical protein